MTRQPVAAGAIQRIFELKITLPQIISAGVVVVIFFVGMYMRGDKLADAMDRMTIEVKELRADVKKGYDQTSTLNGTIALLTFRLDTAESDIRFLKEKRK